VYPYPTTHGAQHTTIYNHGSPALYYPGSAGPSMNHYSGQARSSLYLDVPSSPSIFNSASSRNVQTLSLLCNRNDHCTSTLYHPGSREPSPDSSAEIPVPVIDTHNETKQAPKNETQPLLARMASLEIAMADMMQNMEVMLTRTMEEQSQPLDASFKRIEDQFNELKAEFEHTAEEVKRTTKAKVVAMLEGSKVDSIELKATQRPVEARLPLACPAKQDIHQSMTPSTRASTDTEASEAHGNFSEQYTRNRSRILSSTNRQNEPATGYSFTLERF
jgi:hypothetical protein